MKFIVTYHPLVIEADNLLDANYIAALCRATPDFSETREATEREVCANLGPDEKEYERAKAVRALPDDILAEQEL